MRYKVGVYGGSFDPLHLGHIHNIIRAAALCDELYVVISWCEGRESTSPEMRLRWISESFRYMQNVHVLLLEDKAVDKEEYNTDYYWIKGAEDTKALVGKPIDIVFCGSDYFGSGRFESLYGSESIIHYFDRREIPISSTDIRGWALENWKYIPRLCKPFYSKKVLIIGCSGIGKTTLSHNLALAYNTVCVPSVCESKYSDLRILADITADEMLENFTAQRNMIRKAAGDCNRILFVDADAYIFSLYSTLMLDEETKELLGEDRFAEAVDEVKLWDLVLLIDSQDNSYENGLSPQTKRLYFDNVKALFDKYDVTCESIDGDYLDRFNAAKLIIEKHIKVTSNW